MIKHIAFIPDGNRRYAKKNLKTKFEGHSAGAETFRNVLKWSDEAGIEEVTFWALSYENLSRDKEELEDIFKIMNKFCDEILSDSKKYEKVKINMIGETTLLPKILQDKMHKIQEVSKNNIPKKVNFLVAYGGRKEITNAVKKIAEEVKNGTLSVDIINEDLVNQYLDIKTSPELIIRTGEARLSGFLPWQSTYSELIFLENKLWPELTKEDFSKAIEKYKNITRNFGK